MWLGQTRISPSSKLQRIKVVHESGLGRKANPSPEQISLRFSFGITRTSESGFWISLSQNSRVCVTQPLSSTKTMPGSHCSTAPLINYYKIKSHSVSLQIFYQRMYLTLDKFMAHGWIWMGKFSKSEAT